MIQDSTVNDYLEGIGSTTTDLPTLTKRFLEIEEQYKMLSAEIEDLKRRIRSSMIDSKVTETEVFKLYIYQKHAIKTDFLALSQELLKEDVHKTFEVTLNKEIQEKLGDELMERLAVNIDSIDIVSLRRK